MMNPGSSHPLDPAYQPRTLPCPAAIQNALELVPTQADTTQYQIMRVMALRSWSHARILNLSDLREPKSGQFLSRLNEFTELEYPHWHSLFSPGRVDECTWKLGKSSVPSIVGWGQDTGLRTLALLALGALQGRRVVGVPAAANDGVSFRHPSPMLQTGKDSWISKINSIMGTPKERTN
jgi:hypothetical protein